MFHAGFLAKHCINPRLPPPSTKYRLDIVISNFSFLPKLKVPLKYCGCDKRNCDEAVIPKKEIEDYFEKWKRIVQGEKWGNIKTSC